MRIILTIGVLLLISGFAWACKCVPLKFADEVRYSDRIFLGKVILITQNTYELEVLQSWKGATLGDHVSIVQGQTSCERRTFELNREYIFYVHGTSVWNCSRTALYLPISLDSELLDLEFYNIGDRDSIQSVFLTTREVSMFRSFLKSKNIDIAEMDSEIRFALDKQWVSKWSFYNALQSGIHETRVFRLNLGNGDCITVLWIGENWKKSSRKLRKRVHYKSQHIFPASF